MRGVITFGFLIIYQLLVLGASLVAGMFQRRRKSKMPYKDLERRKEHQKVYHKKNKDKISKQKKEYLKRPEVKARKKEYHKNYMKEYYQKPEVKKYYKEYNQRPEVKEKRKEYQKEYAQLPKVKKRRKEYSKRPEVKERLKNYFKGYAKSENGENVIKEYREKNREKILKDMVVYREKNRENISKRMKEYGKNNRDKINFNYKQRKKIDKSYAVKERVRLAFSDSLKKYSTTGKVMSTSKYLDMDAIIEHLQPFPDISLYEVDHIMPLSRFNHDDPEQVRRAWLPSNLQWLPKEINRWKRDRLIIPMTKEQQDKLLRKLKGK